MSESLLIIFVGKHGATRKEWATKNKQKCKSLLLTYALSCDLFSSLKFYVAVYLHVYIYS